VRALVTGGAGFLGSHLVDRLVADGHQVTVIDDLSTGHAEQLAAAADLHRLDVASPWVGQLLLRVRPELVFHLAAQADLRLSVRDPLADARTNVTGTVQLLTAAVASGVRRMVFASSGGAIYGDTEQIPTNESHVLRPASPYGAAKMAGEAYLSAFAGSFGLETVALRMSNIYGPRQDPHGEAGVVAIFTNQLMAGLAPVINGDGRQTRDYVFVEDVVEAFVRAASGPAGAYNVSTAKETSVMEICGHLQAAVAALGSGVTPPSPTHGPAKAGEQMRSCLDWKRAREKLGWEPKVSIASGLARTVSYYAKEAEGYL
jgi:UDP-glucose 4-epimerase